MNPAARSCLLVALALLAVQGCATSRHRLDFEPGAIDAAGHVRKVDQFVVIVDGSLSMAEPSRGQPKNQIAERLLTSFNQTVPDLDYEAGLRTFGHGLCGSTGPTVSIVDLGTYIDATFDDGIDRYRCSNGFSPLNRAIAAAGSDLADRGTGIALIIVSDGLHMGRDEIEAAASLREAFGDGFDIHAIQIGNDHQGRKLLDRVVSAGGDGSLVAARELTSPEAMRRFVTEALLWPDGDGDGVPDHLDECPDTPAGVTVDDRGCPVDSDGDGVPDHLDDCPDTPAGVTVDDRGCPIDSDGDGVPDHLDRCPGTPMGTPVDGRGCPLEGIELAGDEWFVRGRVLFDVNRAIIKPEAAEVLRRVADFLIANPQYRVEIQGNTDGTGPLAWNMELSRRRAESVRDELIANGVDGARLTTKGVGPHEPIASNTTSEGRAKNRRVDFKPSAR